MAYELVGFKTDKGPSEAAGTSPTLNEARAAADKMVLTGKYYGVGVRLLGRRGAWSYLTADIAVDPRPAAAKIKNAPLPMDGNPLLEIGDVSKK